MAYDRLEDRLPGYDPGEVLVEIVRWTSLAGASGLVGAVVTDSARGLRRRLRRRLRADRDAPLEDIPSPSANSLPPPQSVEVLADGTWLLRYRLGGEDLYEIRVRPIDD